MPKIKPLSEAQNHRCCYCGNRVLFSKKNISIANLATRDHIISRAAGGKNGRNLVVSCLLCNQMRGDLPALTFFNLQQKWFQSDPTLQERWHRTDRYERQSFKHECLCALEIHLRKRAKQSTAYAFRHFDLIARDGHHFGNQPYQLKSSSL